MLIKELRGPLEGHNTVIIMLLIWGCLGMLRKDCLDILVKF
jgi:hypothetical protein